MMTQQEELNQYSVLALDAIHELQQTIHRQHIQIEEGLERERQYLANAKELREMVEELTAEVAQHNEKRKA